MISPPKFRPIIILAVMTAFINLNSHNAFSETVEEDGQHHLDYDTLSHTLTLKRLRAGNHGGSTDGINRYYFKVTLIGLIDEESQHILEFDKKNKFIEDYLNFGDLELKAFRSYLPDEKGKNTIALEVKGDAVREVVRKSMNSLKSDTGEALVESKIGVKIDLTLFIKQKKYYFLNDDQLVKKTSYFVLPFQSSDKTLYENQELTLEDEKGLFATLQIKYKNSPKDSSS